MIVQTPHGTGFFSMRKVALNDFKRDAVVIEFALAETSRKEAAIILPGFKLDDKRSGDRG
jgi:hypothetical protein